MNKRALMLAGSVLCGAGAFYFVFSHRVAPPPPPAPAPAQVAPVAPQTVVLPAPPIAKTDLLVAAVSIPAGERIKPEQLKWQPWPSELVPAGAILRSASPSAIDSLKGAAARVDIAAGDVMTPRKAVRLGDSGYLATILSPGMRAAAVPLDPRGARSAGGFIAPSDRVDVLLTVVDPKNPSQPSSRTVLQNIRVLAIGQNVGDATVQATAVSPNAPPPPPPTVQGTPSGGQGGSQRLFMADNATLEVTPAQALDLAAAAKGGEITLVLRASSDLADIRDGAKQRQIVTKIGFGIVRQMGQ